MLPGVLEAEKQLSAESLQSLEFLSFQLMMKQKKFRIMIRDIQIKINSLAGKDLYSSGKLDRPELAKLIFNDKELLEKVNSLVHPAVF